jgi:hypothetical protein
MSKKQVSNPGIGKINPDPDPTRPRCSVFLNSLLSSCPVVQGQEPAGGGGRQPEQGGHHQHPDCGRAAALLLHPTPPPPPRPLRHGRGVCRVCRLSPQERQRDRLIRNILQFVKYFPESVGVCSGLLASTGTAYPGCFISDPVIFLKNSRFEFYP